MMKFYLCVVQNVSNIILVLQLLLFKENDEKKEVNC
jgi:hypothetical protein